MARRASSRAPGRRSSPSGSLDTGPMVLHPKPGTVVSQTLLSTTTERSQVMNTTTKGSTVRQGQPDSPPVNGRLEALTADLPAEELALVSAAASLVPVLSAGAETADATGRLPDDAVAALRKEGLFRLATPRKYGGHEAGACTATAIAAEVARGCPSASWVLTVYY